jgi:hypothetical protein
MVKGSYVLVSRNDKYCGNAFSRLTNTLNFLGESLNKTENLENSECILVDWGSEKPLHKELILNSYIRKILKVVYVPNRISKFYQKDSPFSEVHAMNCGFRNMSGKYFMRIDQDTLVGYRFINWFYNEFEEVDYGFDWPLSAFSGRRDLTKDQSKQFKKIIGDKKLCYEVPIVHPINYHNCIGKLGQIVPFYNSSVGIMIVERNLYESEKGFNEDFIYMNQMDGEFMNRISSKHLVYNLSQKIDNDFYHQYHNQIMQRERKTNDVNIKRGKYTNTNKDNWGLKDEKLEIINF